MLAPIVSRYVDNSMDDALHHYSTAVHKVAAHRRYQTTSAMLKRGEMLIWRGNLLHGGSQVGRRQYMCHS
jgi:hypothetical protein